MSAKTDYREWVKDVEYWVRIKTSNPFYHIEESEVHYPLGEMFNDDWSAGDVADDIVAKVEWD